MAKYLYESDNIATEGTTKNLKINPEKISSFGFNTNYFSLISNAEWNIFLFTESFQPIKQKEIMPTEPVAVITFFA